MKPLLSINIYYINYLAVFIILMSVGDLLEGKNLVHDTDILYWSSLLCVH